MTDFIEVHENGVKSLINLAWVEEIRPSEDKAESISRFRVLAMLSRTI